MTLGGLELCLQRKRGGIRLGGVWQRRRRRKCERMMGGGLVKKTGFELPCMLALLPRICYAYSMNRTCTMLLPHRACLTYNYKHKTSDKILCILIFTVVI